MSAKDSFYEDALAAVRQLAQESGDLRQLLGCYAALLEARRDTKSAFRLDARLPDSEEGRSRNAEGRPFLSPADVVIDAPLFGRLFDRVGALIREHAETPDADADWPSVQTRDAAWHSRLVEALLSGTPLDEAAAEARIGVEPFTFIACQALAPFLEAYAEQVADQLDTTDWEEGRCPVCGAEPVMGRLEKETGKRVLQCHLCRAEWRFKRLQCPFCDNLDQKTLRYFSAPEDAAHRVEVCDRCQGYIKTVDARETTREWPLFVENIATLHLDLIAKEEGFHRNTNRLFGF
ncbi:MAG: formate dehydrogenase accessory protein FdhE [Kiritimatiellae bacterium]|nr:formate dehydrogenase accessory protein FdhE [Kiritimatiellia bacterium]